MNNNNKEYIHGYTMGYDCAAYEGCANIEKAKRNILQRGISLRTVYAVAFLNAVKDYINGKPRRYNY